MGHPSLPADRRPPGPDPDVPPHGPLYRVARTAPTKHGLRPVGRTPLR